MTTLAQSQVFFFISSIGFVVLWILAAMLLFYVIRAVKTFSRIMNKLETGIDTISDNTVDLLEELRDSAIFNLIFRRKRKSRKD